MLIAGYASTPTRDSQGDIVSADVWTQTNAMKRYKKNPILLLQHDMSDPIGRVTKWYATELGLFIECDVLETEFTTKHLIPAIKDGTLRAFSIGFRGMKGSFSQALNASVITSLELLEISIVSVPSNEDCLFFVDSEKERSVRTLDSAKVYIRR